MSLLKSVLFIFFLVFAGFSLYSGHYNSTIYEVIVLILIFLSNRYPNNKILHMLFTKLAPVPEDGMLYSQYISQLILFNAKYIFILWTILTIMYHFNPDILRNLSSSSSNILPIIMATLFIFMLMLIILLVINLIKYIYIKFFNRDRIYENKGR